jgi:hypothetical protein
VPGGRSLHIGLNSVDPTHYYGWNGHLSGCLNDAYEMKRIAESRGFLSSMLIDAQATASAVTSAIHGASTALRSGDVLLLTYSGHGGQLPDPSGIEPSGMNQTWVLYDRMLLDDELYALWSEFEDGVRVIVISDSCHSGTVTRALVEAQFGSLAVLRDPEVSGPDLLRLFRAIPSDIESATYVEHQGAYARLRAATPHAQDLSVQASVLLIAACQDNQLAADGIENGLFTATLLDVWDTGRFLGGYADFAQAITAKMPSSQRPNYYKVGRPSSAFETEAPFSIAAGGVPSQGPSVEGPKDLSRGAGPPAFRVRPGSNRYYIFEITSQPELFDPANLRDRTASNFYATWDDPTAPERLTQETYDLPQSAWDRLRFADRLYFRVGTTSTATGWDNYRVSTFDDKGATAPYIQLTDGTDTSGVPSQGSDRASRPQSK